jgi:hypothetical protein
MASHSKDALYASQNQPPNQGTKRRQIIGILQQDYGISLSQDSFRWYITLFSHGIPQMEKLPTWDAVDFILDDNLEPFAYFIYGLNAFKNYKKQSQSVSSSVVENPQSIQTCYKTNKPCQYNCQGLCKDSY